LQQGRLYPEFVFKRKALPAVARAKVGTPSYCKGHLVKILFLYSMRTLSDTFAPYAVDEF
jgi:hypothetical protein